MLCGLVNIFYYLLLYATNAISKKNISPYSLMYFLVYLKAMKIVSLNKYRKKKCCATYFNWIIIIKDLNDRDAVFYTYFKCTSKCKSPERLISFRYNFKCTFVLNLNYFGLSSAQLVPVVWNSILKYLTLMHF